MKKLFLATLSLMTLNLGNSQSLKVEEVITIDPNSGWPFTWDIEVSNDNTIYVGNELGKVYAKQEEAEFVELELPEEINSDVRSIKFGEDGRMWVGTSDSGIHVLDGDEWTSYNMDNANVASNNFRFLEVSTTGDVYCGGDAGIYVFTNDQWLVANENNGLLHSNSLSAMAYNPTSGNTYVGIGTVLYTITAQNQISNIDLDDSFGWNTRVNCFFPDGNRMLIGTAKGLLAIEDGTISDLRDISGEEEVNDVLLDSKSRIWFGRTFFGLSVYDNDSLYLVGSSDTIPNQIFDMVPFGDNVLVVGNRGARLASASWESAITSIEDKDLVEIKIVPSVTEGIVSLMDYTTTGQAFRCDIISEDGATIKSEITTSLLDLSSVPSGIYYIRTEDVNQKTKYATQKIIKI